MTNRNPYADTSKGVAPTAEIISLSGGDVAPTGPCIGFHVATAGNVVIKSGPYINVVPVVANQTLSCRVDRFIASGTTATGIVAYVTRSTFTTIKSRISTSRVDFVGIGDSNQLYSNFGWDYGFQYALNAAGYPTFGTGLITANENAGAGGGSGAGYSSLRIGATLSHTGAPSEVTKYLDKGGGNLGPMDYSYVSPGTTLSATAQLGINLNTGWVGNVQAELQYDVYTATFDSGAGQFRLFHRLSDNTQQLRGSTVLTNTGSIGGLVKSSLNRSAIGSVPTVGTQFMFGQLGYVNAGATPVVGPFFATFQRVTIPSQTTGWSYSTLYGVGGQSLRTMAVALQQASLDTLTHYFSILRSDQGNEQKTVVITVNSGVNDRNETQASVGPNPTLPGDSADAFVDNFMAVKSRLEKVWEVNRWPVSELSYLLSVSHPIESPDDSELIAYRSAVSDRVVGISQVQVIDLSVVTNSTEMLANNWYQSSGADRNHLTQSGYETIGTRIISALR